MIIPFVFTLLLAPQDVPNPVAPVEVGPDSTRKFAMDFTGLKENGDPGAQVTHVEFEYATTGSPIPVKLVKVPLVPILGTNTVSMRVALAGVPSGIYNMRVRWYDVAAQPSKFSEPPLLVKNTVVPPAPPVNVSVVDN